MKGKRRFWRQLDKRLITIISIIVIPINFLAIILSTVVIKESRERVMATYENEFNMFMDREGNMFVKLDNWYMSFVGKYIGTLNLPWSFSAVNSISLTNEISSAMSIYGFKGFFFLKEQQEEQKMYVKGTRNLYTPEQIAEIKNELLQLQMDKEWHLLNGKWHIEERGRKYFYFKSYYYQNYMVGFGIDLYEEMAFWLGSDAMQGCSVLLTDGKSAVLVEGKQEPSAIGLEQADQLLQENGKIIRYHIGTDEEGLDAYLINLSGEQFVPSAYLVLQLFAYLSLILLVILWSVIRRQVVRPLRILQEGMRELDGQEWFYRIEADAQTDDYEYIYAAFNKMADDILISHEKDIQLYQMQLDNLKLQVNPHMLLNSLNTIYSLAETGQYQPIQKFVMNMVEYFRYCLKENNALVPLKSELKFVENYMEIQKTRYPGEMAFTYNVEPELVEALIPPLLIQNFVENASKYARIADSMIEIMLNVRREKDWLYISVSDTGKGIEPDILQILNEGESYIDQNGQKHLGVCNCKRRMAFFYGDKAMLQITSTRGAGTQVWMELPFQIWEV